MPDKKHIRNSTAEFLIFSAQSGGDGLEVRYEDETIWLSQKLMARLFEVDVRTVSEHLGNIYESAEIKREATLRKFRTVQTEGSREVTREVDHDNLDAIISVGYRVNSVHWHISKLIALRRSNSERQLHDLYGNSSLLPKYPAFHPDGEGLQWRWQKLIA